MNAQIRRGLMAVLLCNLCAGNWSAQVTGQKKITKTQSWQQVLLERLPVYGHRNWIVIADSAYPAQSRAGIETVAVNGEQLEVLRTVLDQLSRARHVRPLVYLDAELPHIPEQYAPGIGAYRTQLKKLLGERQPQALPHEQIIAKLDEAGAKFNVLILKTRLALPYTSVFLELDCGYWSAEAEQKLREAMRKNQ